MLVPLLAFNEDCHRLGYGGGFYDRTINKLKGKFKLEKDIVTIGLGLEVLKYSENDENL